MNPISETEVFDRFKACTLRLAALGGQLNQLRSERQKLAETLQDIKNRQAILDEVTQVFDALQAIVHRQTVGEYEALINDFLHDVVPDAGQIRFEIGTSRSVTSLDVLLEKPQGTEDILNAQGGGVTNVIVAGLVYSALWRSVEHRRLVVLDEPDCWLKSIYVPALTRVLAQISDLGEEGFQTLMISHNDASLVDEAAHVHELHLKPVFERAKALEIPVRPCEEESMAFAVRGKTGWEIVAHPKANMPVIFSRSGAKPWPDDVREGIRWIELINVQRHVWTRIECSPGLNVLTGDINSGKSTLFYTALRALAYGESSDAMITHGAQEMVIRVGLERQRVVELVRRRTGSQKITYRIYESGELIHESPQGSRASVPDAVRDVLRISRIDEMDVQLRSQKSPVFLLDETGSRRANLLSVGQEVGYLKAMMEEHRAQVQRDRDAQKRLEPEFERLRRIEEALLPIMSQLQAQQPIMESMIEEFRVRQTYLDSMNSVWERLNDPRRTIRMPQAPLWVELHDLQGLNRLGQTIRRTRSAFLDVPRSEIKIPVLHETKRVEHLCQVLGQTKAGNLRLPRWDEVIPKLHETDTLVELGKKIRQTKVGLLCLPKVLIEVPQLSDMAWFDAFFIEKTRAERIEHLAKGFPRSPLIPVVKTKEYLVQDIERLSKTMGELEKEQCLAIEAKKEVERIEEAFERLKETVKVCPLCERPFEEHKYV